MALLNDNLLRMMAPEDRLALGLGGGHHRNAFRTREEIEAKNQVKEESTLARQLVAFCGRHGLCWASPRTDKRSTIRKGWPDFTVVRRVTLFHPGGANGPAEVPVTLAAMIELKARGGRLSEAQKAVIAELSAAGITVHVCYTYSAVLDALRTELLLP
jgi:hypothetical protein